MAAPKRDNELAARVLIESILTDDRTATDKFGITTRTLRRYRKALAEDPELSAVFQENLRALMRRSWTEKLDGALCETIDALLVHIKTQMVASPDSIEAITKAFSALGEVAIAREVLGVATDKQDAALGAPAAADGEGEGADLLN